jgi:hypothetical protein
MERIAGYVEPLFTLEEAEKDFKQAFTKAMNDPRKMWFIIKSQTSIGKTKTYLELVMNTSLPILIVVPTNILKREIGKRAKEMGIEIIESPSLREIKDDLPPDVWDHIEYLYASGKSVIPYLEKLTREDHPECAKLFKRYLREMKRFKTYEGHAITTHKRFLSMNVSKYDLVVIDEDILLGSIIQNKTNISLHELTKLRKETAPGSAVRKKINKALKYIKTEDTKGDFFTLPAVDFDKADDGIAIGVDIPSFCSVTHFLFRRASDMKNNISEDCVSFIKPVKFKTNTKYIMVSATVDKTVCVLYFKNNIEFYECKKAAYTGTLNQYYNRSMSRADIDKDPVIIDQIVRRSGFKHLITHKKYNRGDLHFGNTEGCDDLKGENINVIGTPHQPEWVYKLFAYTIGCKFDTEAKIKPCLTVEHNGYRFRFTTYEDEELRAIQFFIIESQLEQAIGRARLLRCNCIVNLFSNFPLSQTVMKEA